MPFYWTLLAWAFLYDPAFPCGYGMEDNEAVASNGHLAYAVNALARAERLLGDGEILNWEFEQSLPLAERHPRLSGFVLLRGRAQKEPWADPPRWLTKPDV